MAPVAPYITEELWSRTGHDESIHLSTWPEWKLEMVQEDEAALPVQVNGRKRTTIQVPVASSQAAVLAMAMAQPEIARLVKEDDISRVVYVPGKILNVVCG
jgi:leucyl-tRNA synthetase